MVGCIRDGDAQQNSVFNQKIQITVNRSAAYVGISLSCLVINLVSGGMHLFPSMMFMIKVL